MEGSLESQAPQNIRIAVGRVRLLPELCPDFFEVKSVGKALLLTCKICSAARDKHKEIKCNNLQNISSRVKSHLNCDKHLANEFYWAKDRYMQAIRTECGKRDSAGEGKSSKTAASCLQHMDMVYIAASEIRSDREKEGPLSPRIAKKNQAATFKSEIDQCLNRWPYDHPAPEPLKPQGGQRAHGAEGPGCQGAMGPEALGVEGEEELVGAMELGVPLVPGVPGTEGRVAGTGGGAEGLALKREGSSRLSAEGLGCLDVWVGKGNDDWFFLSEVEFHPGSEESDPSASPATTPEFQDSSSPQALSPPDSNEPSSPRDSETLEGFEIEDNFFESMVPGGAEEPGLFGDELLNRDGEIESLYKESLEPHEFSITSLPVLGFSDPSRFGAMGLRAASYTKFVKGVKEDQGAEEPGELKKTTNPYDDLAKRIASLVMW